MQQRKQQLQVCAVRCESLQGHWMVFGGACDDIEQPDEEHSQLHVFDLKTLSWLKPPVDNAGLGYRTNHMAACHNESLIVLGGQPFHSLLPVASAHCLCKLPWLPCTYYTASMLFCRQIR